MKKFYDWKDLLKAANEELAQHGYEIKLIDYDGHGYYICDIRKDGRSEEVYDEGFFGDELLDVLNEAWEYIKTEKIV